MIRNICGLIFWIIMLILHFVVSGFTLLIICIFTYCGFKTNDYITITLMVAALGLGVVPFLTILFGECDCIGYYFSEITNKVL